MHFDTFHHVRSLILSFIKHHKKNRQHKYIIIKICKIKNLKHSNMASKWKNQGQHSHILSHILAFILIISLDPAEFFYINQIEKMSY